MSEDYGYATFNDSVDSVLVGSRTYRQILEFDEWPYPGKPAWVFSRMPLPTDEPDITVTPRTPLEVVAELEALGLRRPWLVGGGTLAGAFQAAGLIAEYVISTIPVVLGSGVGLLGGAGSLSRLALIETKRYPGGVLQSRYQPGRSSGGSLRIRDMASGEEPAVLELVMRGFDEVVRPDCSDEGVAEFTRAARLFVVGRAAGHHVLVAERDGELLGMIDVRDSSHVSLFFVESGERGHGVGRALLRSAIEPDPSDAAGPDAATVNSSPWAVQVYERLGFSATGPLREQNGILFVPMAKPL